MLWPRSGRLLLGGLVVSVLVVAACSAKHDPAPGELLLAIDANLNVPDDIDEIGISVIASDGTVASLDHIYAMAPVGAAEFPATLAIVRGTSNPIDIKVAGFKSGSAIILREVVTTIPADRTAILRVDLNWLDEGSTSGAATTVQSLTTVPACDSGQTSIEGTCQSFMLDSASLATFSEGAIVSSTSNACTDMDQCIVGTADQPIAGSISVPQPTLQMVTGPDGGVSPSCSIAVPGIVGLINIGIVPKSNAAGWCNETTCVVPLASHTTDGSGGPVQLPLSICMDSRIASLVIVPVTGSCPLYGEDHPACQDYGTDAGTSDDAGTRFDAGTFDAGTFDAQVPSLISFNCESNPGYTSIIGLAVDVESGESYAFVDGGAAFLPGTVATTSDAGQPAYLPIATNFDPGATSFAASGDLVAVGSMSGVQVLSAGSGLDAGWYASNTSAPISVAFQPQAGSAPRLVAAGLDGVLFSIEADGGVTFDQWATTPTLLAYDDTMGRFLVASMNNGTSEWYLSSVTIGSGGRPPAPTPFASEGQGIQAITFSDPDTGVWVDQQNQFYAAAITADGGAGTALNVQTGLLAGAPSLAGSGGRLAWIGTNGHVYTMNVVNGVALSAPLDLSTRATASSVGVGFTNASQVGFAPGFLVWVQAGGNVCATPLAALPY